MADLYNAVDPNQPKRRPQPGDPDYDPLSSLAAPSGGPMPAAPTAVPPAAAPAPASAPSSPDPFAAMGGGTLVNGGWIPNNNPEAIARARGQVPAGPGPVGDFGPGGNVAPQPAQPAPAPPPPTIQSSFKDALLKQLGVNQEAPSLSDPALKAQADAFSLAQQRGNERAQNQLAEQAALEGTRTSGGFLSDKLGLEQQRGEAEGAFNAGLVGQEAAARRDKLVQYVALAGNTLTEQDRMAVQKELADLNAQIERERIAQQGTLGQADIGLRGRLGEAQVNLGLLQALMQNQQFGQGLGAQLGQYNQNALLQTLGML
jgi:hypothetical protein